MDPRPRFTIVARGHLADVRKRFEPRQAGRPAASKVVGDVIDSLMLRARLSQVGFEVLGEPFIEPERKIAERTMKQGMSRFMTQVFLEARARVGVDDALASLCQEECSPRRQLGDNRT